MKHSNKRKSMQFLPVSVNITGKNILFIGAGKTAYHKLKFLMPFTRKITVLAKKVIPEMREYGLKIIEKDYEIADLDGYFLVYVCTDDTSLSKKIYNDARSKGILVSVVDYPLLCDFVSPAIYKKGHMTVAVASNTRDVYASIRWRDKICDFVENVLLPEENIK